MADHWWFQAIVTSTLFILCATNVLADSSSDTTPKPCPKTLSLCTLEIDDVKSFLPPPRGDRGDPGDKGEVGEDGFEGSVGKKGIPGLQGVDGIPGSNGIQGPIGIKGLKGLQGDQGIKGPPAKDGVRGEPGPQGFPGTTGPDGKKAEDGDEGLPGLMGPPGPPGTPGSCPCDSETVVIDDSGDSGDSGDSYDYDGMVEDLQMKVCKNSLRAKNDTEFTTGPGSFKVTCYVRKNLATLTCIPPIGNNSKSLTIFPYQKKFWLSERNMTIENIYGLNREQLTWLQKNSNTAYQTIRYHCYNSNPFPRDNVENSLKLLTWNDNTIGPLPTLTKPMFYNVPTETDGCSKAIVDQHDIDTTSTDITIISDTARRVPVTDFFIQDVRPGLKQSVAIKHFELCFD